MNAKVLFSVFAVLSVNTLAQQNISAVKIGTAPNVFNSSRPFLHQITVNNQTQTISFIHRPGVSETALNKGCLAIDESNDGGKIWSVNKNINIGTVVEGINGARYPQICLTNSGKQFMLAPSVNNNGWDGFYSGRCADAEKPEYRSGKDLFNIPSSFISSDENTFWATDLLYNDGNAVGLKVLKGNLKGEQIQWENNLIYKISECLNADNLPHIESASAIAFDKQGNVGYAAFLSHVNNCEVKQPQLLVFKTNNKGVTWTGPETVDISMVSQDPKAIISPSFELDVAVDSDDRLHLFTAIFNGSGTQYMNNYKNPLGMFDFISEQGQWSALKIADLQALRVYLGTGRSSSQDNRLHLTLSEDRNVIGYSWVDSDTKIVGEGHNTIPNLFVKLIDFKNFKQSDIWNCTSQLSDFSDRAFFPVVAPAMLNTENKGLEIPVVLTQLNRSASELDEVNYYYLKGIRPVLSHDFKKSALITKPEAEVSDLVYPNPAASFIRLEATDKISGIKIYDTFGKLVKTTTDASSIDISSLANGVYLVKAETKSGIVTSRFVKE